MCRCVSAIGTLTGATVPTIRMVQAARSGAQNIAEGSKASATSKKTELKLTNVARASLEELRLGYDDYLRQRRLKQWRREDPRRDELIAKRCTTADAVADWVKELHGQNGPCGPSTRCTPSTKSTPSIRSTPSARSVRSTPSAKSVRSTYQELAASAALVLIPAGC